MGLKTTDYKVNDFGITIPNAYARITNLTVDPTGIAYFTIEVFQKREDLFQHNPLERHQMDCRINKNEPLYTQLYNEAKSWLFADWEDDIVEDDEFYHEDEIHPEFVEEIE